jgi:hypothetical protein
VLHFQQNKTGDPDYESNVKRLTKVFRDEGCQRMKLQNHIPVVVDQQRLNIALRNFGISAP